MFSANLTKKVTGFSEDDLQLLWRAILNMFELDRSAARGNMACRSLIVFKHDSEFGNAPAYKLFDAVKVARKDDVVAPRSSGDYLVSVEQSEIPQGVTVEIMGVAEYREEDFLAISGIQHFCFARVNGR